MVFSYAVFYIKKTMPVLIDDFFFGFKIVGGK